jgi:hypothetical protein
VVVDCLVPELAGWDESHAAGVGDCHDVVVDGDGLDVDVLEGQADEGQLQGLVVQEQLDREIPDSLHSPCEEDGADFDSDRSEVEASQIKLIQHDD